jgi:tetratricopeptide (TPR) repeat protein
VAEDRELQARATFELGSALVHSGRCRYEEGATVLHEVLLTADTLGDARLGAAAARELAWVELLTARYDRAEVWLRQALDVAAGEPRETAAALWVLGMAWTEVARYEESMAVLRKAITLADSASDARAGGIARALLGKAHLMRGELHDARPPLEQSLDIFESAGWTWLFPWAESYLGELELFAGDLDRAEGLLDHALSLSSQVSEPCFCTKSEANLGLMEAMRGDVAAAQSRLAGARMWLIRTPDHLWSRGYALDASCIVGTSCGLSDTGRWIDDLEQLAGRAGMRELVARAYVHRHNWTGEQSALDTARLLAADIDNPRLHLVVDEPERLLL